MSFTKEFREDNKQITVWIDRNLHEQFKEKSKGLNTNMSELVRDAVISFIFDETKTCKPKTRRRLGVN